MSFTTAMAFPKTASRPDSVLGITSQNCGTNLSRCKGQLAPARLACTSLVGSSLGALLHQTYSPDDPSGGRRRAQSKVTSSWKSSPPRNCSSCRRKAWPKAASGEAAPISSVQSFASCNTPLWLKELSGCISRLGKPIGKPKEHVARRKGNGLFFVARCGRHSEREPAV